MDTVRLRTLTWKSVLWFGTYKGMKVQEVFNLDHRPYLRYVYYHYDGISFIDDVLTAIGIFNKYGDRRIEKPGSDMGLYDELQRLNFSQLVHHTSVHTAKYIVRKGSRLKQIRSINMDKVVYSKGNLQRMNQGHSYKR